MTELVKVLMRRDGLSRQEAEELRREMQERMNDGEDPEEILLEEGLELDYFMDLLPDNPLCIA